jgi:glycosyltransferase involved in cell wall biosynthesis
MNILLLNWKDIKNPVVGGAELIAFEFARKLVKDGHSVTFFCRAFPGCVKEEVIDGVRIVRRGALLTVYFEAFFYYQSLQKKPDVVIDMVNTLCWQTPLYVPKHQRLGYVNQLAKEVFFFELPWPLSWIAYYLEKLEYLTYKDTRFLVYSQSTKDDLVSFGIPGKSIELFPMGLDHDRYVSGKKKSKTPLLITVSRLVKMKRVDVCIEAMVEVLKLEPKAELVVVGDGPDKKRLQNMITTLGLEKNVRILDKGAFYVDKKVGDPKVKLMQEAWMLLLPSVKEGWGMVVTEAAACGTPSIVSNVTGLRDSVLHEKTGLVLSANPSAGEMSENILKLIQNNKLRDKLSKQAISWSKEFSWQKSYQTFKKLALKQVKA